MSELTIIASGSEGLLASTVVDWVRLSRLVTASSISLWAAAFVFLSLFSLNLTIGMLSITALVRPFARLCFGRPGLAG